MDGRKIRAAVTTVALVSWSTMEALALTALGTVLMASVSHEAFADRGAAWSRMVDLTGIWVGGEGYLPWWAWHFVGPRPAAIVLWVVGAVALSALSLWWVRRRRARRRAQRCKGVAVWTGSHS